MTDQQATAPDWSRFHGAMVSGTMQGEILSACERAWAWLELPAEDCARRIEDTIHSDVAARWQLQARPMIDFEPKLSPLARRMYMALPDDYNPRTLALARQ